MEPDASLKNIDPPVPPVVNIFVAVAIAKQPCVDAQYRLGTAAFFLVLLIARPHIIDRIDTPAVVSICFFVIII